MSDYLGVKPQMLASIEETGVEIVAFEARRTESGLQAMLRAKNGHLAAPAQAVVLGDPADVERFVTSLEGLTEAQRQAVRERIGERLPYFSWVVSEAERGERQGGRGRPRKKQQEEAEQAQTACIESVCAADIDPKPPKWFWPNHLLCEAVNMIGGDPGVGKTYLTTALATHATRGWPWPDGTPCPQGSVVMLSGEDHQDRIAERLILMQADRSQVQLIKAIKIDPEDDDPRLVRLSLTKGLHVDALKEFCIKHHAVLCMVDPVDYYIESDTNTDRGPAARGITTPLKELAEETGVCAIMVQHLNKAQAMQALYRLKSSIDFIAASRAVHICGFDPLVEGKARRIMLPLKMNEGPMPAGIAYAISDAGLAWDTRPITCTVEDMLAAPSRTMQNVNKGDLARKVLPALLSDGPVKEQVIAATMKALEVGESTMRFAKKDLGITSERFGSGRDAPWWWQLPAQVPAAAAPEQDAGDDGDYLF